MWIDKMKNVVFTDAQLQKRYDAHIQTKFPLTIERAMNRRAFGNLKGKYNPTAEEVLQEVEYEQYCKSVRENLDQAILDNTLLINTLRYEKAQRRLSQYILSEGREEVEEVFEVIDVGTGEVLQEYVPAVIEIASLPLTIEAKVYDDAGNYILETVDNPTILLDVSERQEAQEILDNASVEILELTEERNN